MNTDPVFDIMAPVFDEDGWPIQGDMPKIAHHDTPTTNNLGEVNLSLHVLTTEQGHGINPDRVRADTPLFKSPSSKLPK